MIAWARSHAPAGQLPAWCLAIGWPVAGWLIGHTAWGHAAIATLAAVLALPALWAISTHRVHAAAMILAYFMAGARGMPDGAVVFFGDTAPAWWGIALWVASSSLLALPFYAFWSASKARRAGGFVLALAAVSVPPLGIFGWVNPVTVAGVLFPAAGWFGLLLTLMVFLLLAWGRTVFAIALAASSALVLGLASPATEAADPPGWQGFDTQFSKLSSAGADDAGQVLAAMERIRWLDGVIADMPAGSTLVLPETLLGRFTGSAQTQLSGAEAELRRKGARVLVGAELPIEGSLQYHNAVVVLGAQEGDSSAAKQGIPVPVSMWKPWADDGAQGELLASSNMIRVANQRVAAAVCYEQLLTYSMLKLMHERPTVLIAVSNVWWARTTSVPAIQEQSVHAYARLFNVPAISARNI